MTTIDDNILPQIRQVFGGEIPDENMLAARLIQELKFQERYREVYRSIANLVTESESIAAEAKTAAEAQGNKLIGRKREMEERAQCYTDVANVLREALAPVRSH